MLCKNCLKNADCLGQCSCGAGHHRTPIYGEIKNTLNHGCYPMKEIVKECSGFEPAVELCFTRIIGESGERLCNCGSGHDVSCCSAGNPYCG